MRKMSEHQEQTYFFNWVRRNIKFAKNEELKKVMRLCYSVPNGIRSTQGQKAKMEGLTAGMPDINLDYPQKRDKDVYVCGFYKTIKDNVNYLGLRIEMKFGGNTLSEKQKEKKNLLEEAGFKVVVCYSAKEAIQVVIDYLPFPEVDYIKPKYL